MATASVTAVSDDQLARELKRLQEECATLNTKLEAERANRTTAHFERGRVVEAVAVGKAKEADVRKLDEQLASIAIRIEGHERLLAANKAHTDLVQPELVSRQAAAEKAERTREIETLYLKGLLARERMLANMKRLIAEDFVAFNVVREELFRRFKNDAEAEDAFNKLSNGMHNPDGSPKFTLEMLAEGWHKRGDIIFQIPSLTPPPKK